MDYKQSGVDIESGDDAVRRIKNIARATFTPGVLSEVGAFGGMFRFPSSNYSDPILVSSADGVGTKLKIAFMSGIHDTVEGRAGKHPQIGASDGRDTADVVHLGGLSHRRGRWRLRNTGLGVQKI